MPHSTNLTQHAVRYGDVLLPAIDPLTGRLDPRHVPELADIDPTYAPLNQAVVDTETNFSTGGEGAYLDTGLAIQLPATPRATSRVLLQVNVLIMVRLGHASFLKLVRDDGHGGLTDIVYTGQDYLWSFTIGGFMPTPLLFQKTVSPGNAANYTYRLYAKDGGLGDGITIGNGLMNSVLRATELPA